MRRIDWSPKAENVAAIIRAVNVLPRNVVFVDDNPVERAAVQAAFPDIRVLGADPVLPAPHPALGAGDPGAGRDRESARRTEMIQAAAERDSTRAALSRAEFLATLGMSVRMSGSPPPAHKSFARAFELINKTNQFNTTGKRWTQEAMRAALAAGTVLHAFEVEDRFSRYGLVGVIVADAGRIEQMVMSCRVVGLDVEIAAVAAVLRLLGAHGAAAVTTRLVETDANLLCRDLFARCGFAAGTDGTWISDAANVPPVPAHIRLA